MLPHLSELLCFSTSDLRYKVSDISRLAEIIIVAIGQKLKEKGFEFYSGSHSDVVKNYITRCRGTALPIGVNLSWK